MENGCVSWRQDLMYCCTEEVRRNISRLATEGEGEGERERERETEREHCRYNSAFNYYVL